MRIRVLLLLIASHFLACGEGDPASPDAGDDSRWIEHLATPDGGVYDPTFSPDGKSLAWLQMEKDGFEADKNDIIVMDWATGKTENLTADMDITCGGFTLDIIVSSNGVISELA